MGKVSIYGAGRPIREIFSPSFVFSIPRFQRPYAWTTEQAGELINDLITFIDEGKKPLDELNPYFLGSIVLIKEEKSADAQIIDGQQRLTTLTILLAALRKMLSAQAGYSKFVNVLTGYLYDEADPVADIPNRYRLKLRRQDEEFFRDNIQQEGGMDNLYTLNTNNLSDSQNRIRENALLFLDVLKTLDVDKQIFLLRAVATNCFLVEISTPDLDSAYSVFSVLNSRGLDLSLTDILKAEIIGKVLQNEEETYTARWEKVEDDLGREMFQNLFAYIRTIYRKAKLKDTILKEFKEYVQPASNPKHFIDSVLGPYADAYYVIRNKTYSNSARAEEVNRLFTWLNRIDNSDWIPPAILYYSRNYKDYDALIRFFTYLERLASGLMFQRANVNKRIERYGRLLIALENNEDLYTLTSPLQLSDNEQRDILAVLDSNLYEYGFCKYVLLRLDEALADSGAKYEYSNISVEHVLPQNPAANSSWMTDFPNSEEREKCIHRVGNLVLLSQRKNGQAQRFDFRDKKDKYFSTLLGVVPFAITTQVVFENEWTPLVIQRRQKEMMTILKYVWRLN